MRSNFIKDKSLLVSRCQSDQLEKAHLLAPGCRYKDGDGSIARNSKIRKPFLGSPTELM